MATNDVTGDRITSKIGRDVEKFGDNLEKIFGKKKETNGGWKYEPNDDGSVTNIERIQMTDLESWSNFFNTYAINYSKSKQNNTICLDIIKNNKIISIDFDLKETFLSLECYD